MPVAREKSLESKYLPEIDSDSSLEKGKPLEVGSSREEFNAMTDGFPKMEECWSEPARMSDELRLKQAHLLKLLDGLNGEFIIVDPPEY